MGYFTRFTGELRFKKELKASQIAYLNKFLGEDLREFDEIDTTWDGDQLTWVDLEFSDDFSSIVWDESEKSYDMVEKVNLLDHLMRERFPDYGGMEGSLQAQGEDIDDRWTLVIGDNGMARKEKVVRTGKKVVRTGKKICCPHCEDYFYLEDSLED